MEQEHLENTSSHWEQHGFLCPREREKKKIRPLSSFVHRPKCVWCMDQHTKPSACGRRLTLNKNKRLLMENKRHSAENGSVTILFDMVPARHAKPCKTLKYVSVNLISWIIKGAKQWLISHIPTLVVNLFSGTRGGVAHLQMPTAGLLWRRMGQCQAGI